MNTCVRAYAAEERVGVHTRIYTEVVTQTIARLTRSRTRAHLRKDRCVEGEARCQERVRYAGGSAAVRNMGSKACEPSFLYGILTSNGKRNGG